MKSIACAVASIFRHARPELVAKTAAVTATFVCRVGLCLAVGLWLFGVASGQAGAQGNSYTDPNKADADFAFQGEYSGEVGAEGEKMRVGVQLIALGKGKFKAVAHIGGLPGDGWNGQEKHEVDGELQNDAVVIRANGITATARNGILSIRDPDEKEVAKLMKVERRSPTLGSPPPSGAVVLFDGKSVDAWKDGKRDGELLVQGTTSKANFGSHSLHIEFRLPYEPEKRGQARGNSGIYIQGRYEAQMLDSFGLSGEQNECGGIYSVKKPDVNMCLPPLAWQTYDIEYTAGKYDDNGKCVTPPRITVSHNGVLIHKDVELPGDRNTTAAPLGPGKEPGPVYLQDHGNPVRYRNIWVKPKP
ncbi:MAG: DUF1080 domain-containing protein [Planctomycetes bacterium]|nr:DUF1080 domain-containing protein [Planctomycetota bacterium]